MTISLPSHEIYVVDIPEIHDFSAKFQYNFFVPDEAINDSGGVSDTFLLKGSDDVNADFVQYATTRAPRFVVFNFTPVRLSNSGRDVSDVDVRKNVFGHTGDENLISDNITKIVTEDQFASYDFISVQFHDGDIDEKVHYLVSGSYEQHTLDDENDSNTSHIKAAGKLHSLLPKHIEPHFLDRALVQMARATGVQFTAAASPKSGNKSKASATKHRDARNSLGISNRDKTMLTNKFFTRLQRFQINAQINGKLFHEVVKRTIDDPNSSFGDDLHTLHQVSKQIQLSSRQRFSLQVAERDFKTIVPFVNLHVRRTAHHIDKNGGEIVGYLIDKTEITRDLKTIHHDPIVLENPQSKMTADFKVRYGSTYVYTIRSIARFTLPAIDDDTGDIATIQILVSSKPSSKIYVKTRESIAPPSPSDLNFTWDYENDTLMIHWTFPPNSQRDIKKFQVFRRKNIDHPFELIKMYDFDDSAVKWEDNEDPDPSLVEYITSPATFYVDDDFTRESRFIYGVACVDAHGATSNFSAQFEVWFDPFKNKLQKKLISHSGAPKPYPNLYLHTDTFVDTIRVSGPNTRRLRVYFNPEHYFLVDDDDRLVNLIATKQRQGEYNLQLINVDNQKDQKLTIRIDDRMKPINRKIVFPKTTFGKVNRQKV